jgi:hypothetical protein
MAIKLKTKDFASACKVLAIEPVLPEVAHLPEQYQKRRIDDHIKEVMADAINKETEFIPNFGDVDQWKYFAVFRYKGPSVGWVYDDYYYCAQDSGVGSRLVFKNSEICKYWANLVIKLKLSI